MPHTARYSPVAPISLLQQLHQHNLLGDYLLLLAHDVLEHPEEYLSLTDDVAARYANDLFIIMDNSVIETGAPLPMDKVLQAANIVSANVVVSPDVIGDFESTKILFEDVPHELKQREFGGLMLVPQGDEYKALYDCVDWYLEHSNSVYWGVPRWIANTFGTRKFIVDYIADNCSGALIHLLGMSAHLNDDLEVAMHPNVIGIDSANPLVLGLHNVQYSTGGIHLPRGDYWCVKELNEDMVYNVRWLRNALCD